VSAPRRHLLVDTQGNVLAVKVTGAQRSDQEGGRMLLSPLKEKFPKMKILWGDRDSGGTWAKLTLGWTIQTYTVFVFFAVIIKLLVQSAAGQMKDVAHRVG